MLVFNKHRTLLVSVVFIYVISIPNLSDFAGYKLYYNEVNFRNFYAYALDPGYLILTSFSKLIGLPFIIFWKAINFICALIFMKFLVGERKNYLTIGIILAGLYLIIYPFSTNLFSNIVRNTIAISLCLYFYIKSARWYWYFLPLFFHITAIIFLASLAILSIIRASRFKIIALIFLLFLPIVGILFGGALVELSKNFIFNRTLKHNLITEYKPAFRYLSYTLYLKMIILMGYFTYHIQQKQSLEKISKIYFNLNLEKILLLIIYFSLSLFLFWSFIGVGSTSRILTFPMLFGNSLWFSLIVVGFVSITKQYKLHR